MKTLVFGASNHSASINKALAQYAARRFQNEHRQDAELDPLDLNDFEMPIYSIDRERADGVPQLAQDFFARIGAADALIISYPEYNGTYTSAWKNIYDWMSRIDAAVYQNKPAVALAATPGPRAGAGVLGAVEASARFFGMDLRGRHGVGVWKEAFDSQSGVLRRPEDIDAIDDILAELAKGTG
jgi:NAD(P)H-dependent FMN reductase